MGSEMCIRDSNNDYPESIKPAVAQLMRKLYFIVGPIMLFLGLQEYLGWFGEITTLIQLIGIVLVLVIIAVFVIILFKRFGKEIKKSRVKRIR